MNKKKVVALATGLALIVTSLIGCNSGTTEEIDWSSVRLTEEPVTMTYWVNNALGAAVSDYSENLAYQELEKRTGITMSFLHPSGEQNQLDMLIAAGTLPDIIETVPVNGMPGGADKAIADGVIIRLNELIDEYAPHYKAAREADKESDMLTKTDQGNIYAFAKLLNGEELPWSGPVVRKDLLETYNLDVPETIDDWYNMLRTFKDNGIEIPLTISHQNWDTVNEFGAFIGTWDVNKGFVLNDGKVVYGPIQSGYRDFLATFHKWYEEGLLDNNFHTNVDDKGTLAAAGKIGAGLTVDFGDYEVVAAPYPKLTEDSEVHFRQKNWRNRGYEGHITTACQYPELAVKWFDYHYDTSPMGGAKLFDWGIEGVNYTMYKGKEVTDAFEILKDFYGVIPESITEEGYPKLTDLVLDDPLGYWAALDKYKVNNGPYLKDVYRVVTDDLEKIVNEDYMVWAQAGTEGMLPVLTMQEDESVTYWDTMDPINSYVGEMYIKFITGEESLDKWDEYVATIKGMGIETARQITEDVYTRMLNR